MDVPTVNVGPRQDGRLQAVSILNCPAERDAVEEAISHALDARFRAGFAAIMPPYGRPAPIAARVVDILQRVQGSTVSKKSFFDLNMAKGCP